MGPNGSGKSTLRARAGRASGLRGDRRRGAVRGQGSARHGARRARPRRRVHGVPVPGRDSRREQRLLPQGGAQRAPQAAGPRGDGRDGLHDVHQGEGDASCRSTRRCCSGRSTKGFRAARRSATRSSTWPCSSRGWRFSTRPTRGSTSTRSRSSRSGVNAMRAPDRAFIVVTHYQRLLNYIVPDFVHVLSDGLLVRSGGRELALELEEKGYGWLETAPSESVSDVFCRRTSRRRASRARPLHARAAARARRPGCASCASAARRGSPRWAFRRCVRKSGASPTSRRSPRRRSGWPKRRRPTRRSSPRASRIPQTAARIVILNGHFAPELSSLDGAPRAASSPAASRGAIARQAPRSARTSVAAPAERMRRSPR